MRTAKKAVSVLEVMKAEGATMVPPGAWFLWSDGIYEAGKTGAAFHGGTCCGAEEIFAVEHDHLDDWEWEDLQDGEGGILHSPDVSQEAKRLGRAVRLALAAPELLKTLTALLADGAGEAGWLKYAPTYLVEKANAAITKATGEAK